MYTRPLQYCLVSIDSFHFYLFFISLSLLLLIEYFVKLTKLKNVRGHLLNKIQTPNVIVTRILGGKDAISFLYPSIFFDLGPL